MGVLEEVELLVRTKIAYYHSHKYGPLGYMDSNNFNDKHKHDIFIESFNNVISKNKDAPFVEHHKRLKNNEFPLWVAVELFPFGMLSRFYADMLPKDKKAIAQIDFGLGMEQLESWLLCLSTLRNRCAHYMRLYYYTFNKWPKNKNKPEVFLHNTLFDYVYIMKYCYANNEKWHNSFFLNLETLIAQYEDFIDLIHIGFPDNWNALLKTEY